MWLLPHKGKRSTLIAQAVTLNKDPLYGSKEQASLTCHHATSSRSPASSPHTLRRLSHRQRLPAPPSSPDSLRPSVCLSPGPPLLLSQVRLGVGAGEHVRTHGLLGSTSCRVHCRVSFRPTRSTRHTTEARRKGHSEAAGDGAVDAATAVAPVPGALCAAPPPVPPTVSSRGTSNPSRRSLLSSRSACPAGYFFLELQVF